MSPKRKKESTGSLIPGILKLETDLHEEEMRHKARASQILKDAEAEAKRIDDELRAKVREIEKNEREKLLSAVDSEIELLHEKEIKSIDSLQAAVNVNSSRTVEFILSKIMPGNERTV